MLTGKLTYYPFEKQPHESFFVTGNIAVSGGQRWLHSIDRSERIDELILSNF